MAHSGDRADGEFAHSLNVTDIHTTWVETRAVLGAASAASRRPSTRSARRCPSACAASTRTTARSSSTTICTGTARRSRSSSRAAGPTRKTTTPTSSRRTGPTSASSSATCATTRPAAVAALNAVYRHELRLFQNLFLPVGQARSARSASGRASGGGTTSPARRSTACGVRGGRSGVGHVVVARRDQLDPFARHRRETGRARAGAGPPPLRLRSTPKGFGRAPPVHEPASHRRDVG